MTSSSFRSGKCTLQNDLFSSASVVDKVDKNKVWLLLDLECLVIEKRY